MPRFGVGGERRHVRLESRDALLVDARVHAGGGAARVDRTVQGTRRRTARKRTAQQYGTVPAKTRGLRWLVLAPRAAHAREAPRRGAACAGAGEEEGVAKARSGGATGSCGPAAGFSV